MDSSKLLGMCSRSPAGAGGQPEFGFTVASFMACLMRLRIVSLRCHMQGVEECRKGSSCACRVPGFGACCELELLGMPGLGSARGHGSQRWLDSWSP